MSLNKNSNTTAVDMYSTLGLRTDIASASSHRLILMLLDGAIEKIRAADGALVRGDIATKGASVSWAMSIVDGLRASLDREKGGDLAGNLDRLYEYINRTLLQGNLNNERSKFAETIGLLAEIRGAWIEIRSQVETEGTQAANNDLGSIAHAIG